MIKYILLVILFMSFNVLAEYTYNKPNVILLDKDKQVVPDVTKSVDDSRCLWKAGQQPTGTYYCHQPDIKITVISPQVTVSWVAPTQFTDGTLIDKIDEFKIYINDNPISIAGDKLTYTTNLAAGNYSFYMTTVVDGIESEPSNIVMKEVR